jgi:tight adherence protein B
MGPIFASICQQQSLGVSLADAVANVANDNQSEDLHLFATAVVIQLRSGGSLADMMERLATVMRERMRLARRVRVLTAQTQGSKRVLQAMPVVVFVLLNVINPSYMRPLYATDSGRMVLMFAGGGLLVGSWLMNRLAILRY